MRVGIVAQRGNARATFLADDLRETLDSSGVDVRVDEATARALDVAVPTGPMAECDLVVSIGGDGTFLFAARQVGPTPIMGVNLGEVGFLNATAPEDAVETVTAAVERYRESGEIPVRKLPRLQASGEDWSLEPALNEVVAMGRQRGHGNGVDVEIRVDGSLYGATHADGVLVATPTGSTAYNLSEGGPLVHHGLDALVVTEMCAADPMPPLVTGGDAAVALRLDGPETGHVISDGRTSREVDLPVRVTVETAPEPLSLAGPPVDFFGALEKLD